MHFHRLRPRTWAAVVFLAAASPAATPLSARGGIVGHLESPTRLQPGEDNGADCSVPDPGPTASDSKLPDPFTRMDGTRVSTRDDWQCRRVEIKELAEKHAKPGSVTGTVSSSGITVNVSDRGRSTSFSVGVDLPGGPGPFPAVVVYGGSGADANTIKSAGSAFTSYDPFVVGREGTSRNSRHGAFYDIHGSSSDTGLLMAWAWGVSRVIDVIE